MKEERIWYCFNHLGSGEKGAHCQKQHRFSLSYSRQLTVIQLASADSATPSEETRLTVCHNDQAYEKSHHDQEPKSKLRSQESAEFKATAQHSLRSP